VGAGDEGAIRFDCRWVRAAPLPRARIAELDEWRNRLYDLGLIGPYPGGLGVGNVSLRVPGSSAFIISGAATGGQPRLGREHYTLVTEADARNNRVTCEGPIRASSESLTHAAVYAAAPEVGAVLHVHHAALWSSLKQGGAATDPEAERGTPELAEEVARLFLDTNVGEARLFAMGGHEEGVVAFGEDLDVAGAVLLRVYASVAG
jgi:L-ribulose-5-phosphate 4-epimerase